MGYRGFIEHDGNHAPKPPYFLNKHDPQAEGLVGFYPDISTANPRNYVNGKLATGGSLVGANDIGPVQKHGIIGYNGATVGVNHSIATEHFLDGLNEFTLMSWVWKHSGSSSDNQTWWANWSGAGTNQILVRREITSDNAEFFFSTDGTNIADSISASNAMNVGETWFWVIRSKGGTLEVWRDNISKGTDATWGENTLFTPANALAISGRSSGSDPSWHGDIWWPRIYNIGVSDAVVESAFRPDTRWNLAARPDPVTYFATAAAAGGGRIMSSLAGAGGLAGMGGIAGQGGGLAG